MAIGSSTYINLSNSVLLEYEYRNAGSTANEYSTTQAPWFLMEDNYDESILIFNNDDQTNKTGNVRTRMGCSTEPVTSTFGYLKLDQMTFLNDFEPGLTNTSNLPVSFAPFEMVQYDVVRLHLVQGFNFENNEGFFFRLGFNANDGTVIRHMNLAYRKSDNYAQLNPNPFILGGKYYASYIEFKVPALYSLQDEWRQAVSTGTPTTNLPSSRLTNGSGPAWSSLLNTQFGWIVEEKEVNNQTYFNTYEIRNIDLPVRDQFNDVSAVVQESSQGDYLELYAAYAGNIIDNFINQLNNVPGNDYIILHELGVYEYVWTGGATATWVQTSSLEFVQDSNYEDPILYRPIIQNNGAVSYRIDYTVRLYNREDATSIWKQASAQFNNPLKYAKSLQKIYLGTNPIQPKIYNKVYDKQVSMFGTPMGNNAFLDSSNYKEFVTSFLNTNQVMISSENAYMKKNVTTGEYELKDSGDSSSQIIYAQGLGKINMTQGDTFIKFIMYKGSQNQYDFVDLSGVGKLKLNFYADSGEITSFDAIDSLNQDDAYSLTSAEITTSATGSETNNVSQTISSKNGECLFRINSKDAQRISQYTSKQFTITSFNGDSESQIYTGTFVTVGSQVESFQDKKIVNLDTQISEWVEKYNALNSLYELEKSTVTQKNAAITELNQNLQAAMNALDIQKAENVALLQDDSLDEAEKLRLQAEIDRLDAANQTLQQPVINIVDGSCPGPEYQTSKAAFSRQSSIADNNADALEG